ncbi:hypothetical protein [Zhongshania sp. BJYM1]|uniref:hypothetical protein n=1 Tax=Zhongshania aquatica TaxID=2965069 RepID=UPI0022B4D4C2|nr:hypothetical protein [Marortus sp. BJYM1]
MRSASIRLLLTVVMLLQSLAAVADVHQFHQSSDQHEVVSVHLDTLEAVDDVSEQHTDSLDCHHCCHCHGMTSSVLPASQSHIGNFANPAIKFNSVTQTPTKLSTSLYRPPIA